MNNKIIILALVTLVVFLSGCIQSDASKIDGVSPTITSHLKKGDEYYSNAVYDTNKFLYSMALKNCDSANSEFNLARSSAAEASAYAKNSNDSVLISYLDNVVSEIDAKMNATSELKTAIPYLQQNDTVNANNHVGLANGFMDTANEFKTKRDEIIQQNPAKFK